MMILTIVCAMFNYLHIEYWPNDWVGEISHKYPVQIITRQF